MKRLTIFFCVFLIIVSSFFSVNAADTLYEIKTSKTITKGVTLETSQAVTSDGLLDIHALRIPLTDPNIRLAPAESSKEYSLKETVVSLLSDSNAIAGVNGSYFGLADTHSLSFGPVVKNGTLQSVSSEDNSEGNEFAALFINKSNEPFFSFIRTEIRFINNGQENAKISSYNKITNMAYPAIVTTAAMQETAALDARCPGLVKVVVKDSVIDYISKPGENIKIPENGYVLILPKDFDSSAFDAGQQAQLEIKPSGVDFNAIQTAIGGGGLILKDGAFVKIGTVAAGRHPRTAIGVNEEKTQIILVEVDGRSHSIGANPEEMADIMKRYGAYNAMHLDGGGSSAMVVKQDNQYQIINTLPDNYQRKVINALGVYSDAPESAIERLIIETREKNLFEKLPGRMRIYGQDAYYHNIALDTSKLTIETDDPGGVWENHTYTPGRTGVIHITAKYGDKEVDKQINAIALQELATSVDIIKAMPGSATALRFIGIGGDGDQIDVTSEVKIKVLPAELGKAEGGGFRAENDGAGMIECSINGVNAYIPVYVGGKTEPVFDFDDATALSYQFNVTESAQFAYLNLAEPIAVQGEPLALKVSVNTNQTGLALAGKILDADGKELTLSFKTAGRQLSALIPSGARFPIRLSKIYVTASGLTEPTSGVVYIEDLSAVYPHQSEITLPSSAQFIDPWQATLEDTQLSISGESLRGITGYAAEKQNGAAILKMDASKGGFLATNPSQWQRFAEEAKSATVLVIEMNRNPFSFTQPKEFELWHKALAAFEAEGKKIIVVSAAGGQTTTQYRDGVRYINLSEQNSLLKMNINGDNIQYQIQK